jgi:hypothetical protein
LDALVNSGVGLPLLCALLAAALAAPAYKSPYLNGVAIWAPMPAKFPLRSIARAALVVYIVLINAASLTLAHRLPLGSTLVATGFLLLLFLPKEEHGENA